MDNLHTLHWFEFAADDLDSANILAKYGLRKANAVCYHSHQSAEKNLKGYLVAKGAPTPPKIHDLRELCYLCAEYDGAFAALVPHCTALNAYGVRVKYPDEIEVDERKACQAIADAQAIQSFEQITATRAEALAVHKKNFDTSIVATVSDSASEKAEAKGDKKPSQESKID
jgi:HEPN domain-containing protein